MIAALSVIYHDLQQVDVLAAYTLACVKGGVGQLRRCWQPAGKADRSSLILLLSLYGFM